MIKFRRINDTFEPWITIQSMVKIQDKITQSADDGEYYYELYKDNDSEMVFVRFGFDGKNQWWSSNSSTINKKFGIDCTECAIKELGGKYPTSWGAMGVLREHVPVPDCLEWHNGYLMPKPGITFPRGKDYFMSTELDAEGNLIHPKQLIKAV